MGVLKKKKKKQKMMMKEKKKKKKKNKKQLFRQHQDTKTNWQDPILVRHPLAAWNRAQFGADYYCGASVLKVGHCRVTGHSVLFQHQFVD